VASDNQHRRRSTWSFKPPRAGSRWTLNRDRAGKGWHLAATLHASGCGQRPLRRRCSSVLVRASAPKSRPCYSCLRSSGASFGVPVKSQGFTANPALSRADVINARIINTFQRFCTRMYLVKRTLLCTKTHSFRLLNRQGDWQRAAGTATLADPRGVPRPISLVGRSPTDERVVHTPIIYTAIVFRQAMP